jgi:hypothetical protein
VIDIQPLNVAVVVDSSMPRQMAEDIQSTDTGDVWMVLIWVCLGLPPARRRPQIEQLKRALSSATRMEAKIRQRRRWFNLRLN